MPSAAPPTSSDPPLAITHDGHTTRLKWHRARRRADDPAFTPARIVEAMRVGASVEVDLVIHADRGCAILHDRHIDHATTGHGEVSALSAAYLRTLTLRDNTGRPTDQRVLLLEDLAGLLDGVDVASEAMLQLDFKEDAAALDARAIDVFVGAVAPIASHAILSCGDARAVRILCDAVPDLHVGYDPCHHGAIGRVLDSGDFARFVLDAVQAAPRAEMIYLDHGLVLAAADRGADLIAAFARMDRQVDACTLTRIDSSTVPVLRRLVDLGAHQITTDDAETIAAIAASW